MRYRGDRAALEPARPLTLTVREGERIVRRVRAPEELKARCPPAGGWAR